MNVITDINAAGTGVTGISAADKIAQETYLKPFLQQALVKSKVVNKPLNLFDTTKANTQTLNRDYTLTRGGSKIFNKYHSTGGDNLATFLEKQFDAEPANSIYKSHYKVFFLGEDGGRIKRNSTTGAPIIDPVTGNPEIQGLGGYANGIGSKECVMYASPDQFYVAHELMHCMGLYHSFSNNNLHTFEIGQTENIMDYSHLRKYTVANGVLTQMSTWAWQWPTLIGSNEKEI